MIEVFISYSRADRPVAEAIAHDLQVLGVEVWWDHDLLGGDDYRRRISEILDRVQAAIVIWSRRSVDSQWVTSEAAAAREKRVLIPVTIDGAEPPIDFRGLHTIDLTRWVPGDRLPENLVNGLAERLGREIAYAEGGGPRRGAVARFAQQTTQAWYLDFESLLFYFIGQGFACFLVNLPLALLFQPSGAPGGLALPPWAGYLFALLNGVMVTALYLRPALEKRRMAIAVPLFVVGTLVSVAGYLSALAVMPVGEKAVIALVGLATLALLLVTSIAQRAQARH